MVYFDNAATTFPKPPSVIEAVNRCMAHFGANPGRSGHDLSLQAAEAVFATREKAAEFFGAACAEQVIFTLNCTHATNTALWGALRQGDHVLISDLEHNSILRPVHAMAQQGMITYDVVTTYANDDETVDAFRRAINPRTRMIAVTHASNVFGVALPIARLGRLAREQGILFLVDGAQTAGVLPIQVEQMGISFLCTAGHKSLYGPGGTGLLILGKGQTCRPLTVGGTGSRSTDYRQPDFLPDALESGTVNLPGIVGLGAGLAYVEEEGLEALYRREMEMAYMIDESLSEDDRVELYTTPRPGRSAPVISFNRKGLSGEQTSARLNEMGFALRGGLHCAPLAHKKFGTLDRGCARISLGGFNTMEQARQLCSAIKSI